MSSLQVLSKLRINSKDEFEEITRILMKIADNILKDPKNPKIRTLRKSNRTISQKILKLSGGKDSLILLGFTETENDFVFPAQSSLEHLREVKEMIASLSYDVPSVVNNLITPPKMIRKIDLPPFHTKYQNDFLKSIAYRFHVAQVYSNKELLAQAKEILDEANLEELALEKIRAIQSNIKKGQTEDPNISFQDVLLLELLNWFKNDFFTWVDSPRCESCHGETKFSHMSNDPNLLKYTDRVEVHVCKSCNSQTPFPRYNDLNILLATRCGRCGEWANVFTLLCKAFGWDSRHVFDETDHVWTEVYSHAQLRWLHCDPCENVCDKPLMYENGWNKKITYVFAFSDEEIQDVTWRYTSHHRDVLKRRDRCGEIELVDAVVEMRNEWQARLTETRRKYLARRTVYELAELMVERMPDESEEEGRRSGSLTWRLARREIGSDAPKPFVWEVGAEEKRASIRYSSSTDEYVYNSDVKERKIVGWESGAFKINNLFRKVENDWKMVYLARRENGDIGSITWSFATIKPIRELQVYVDHAVYENGKVQLAVSSGTRKIALADGQKELRSTELNGCKYFEVTAILSGGKGDVSWQHAQLFRQSVDSNNLSFSIEILLGD